MFKGNKKKSLEKFLKEFSIDGKTLSKLADLGVEKKEDMTYMTEEMITGSGFNPITQQKLREALDSFRGSSLNKGASLDSKSGGATPSPAPAKRGSAGSSSSASIPEDSARHAKTSGEAAGPAKKAKALFSYTAVKDSQLNMTEGDILTVINDNKKWWMVIQERTGKQGEVPSNYVEMMEPAYLDPDDISMPAVLRGDKPRSSSQSVGVSAGETFPDIPDEDEEAIYEPVDLPADDADWDGPEYADPDACLGKLDVKKTLPPRPNVRRTDLAKIVPKEASPLPEDTRHWSATDVLRWLIQDDLEDFKDVFYANGFEGPMLLTLSASSFKAGGFDAARCDILQISLNKLQNTTKPIYQARVLYTYDAKKKSQLSVEEGSIIDVLDDATLWWKAQDPITKAQGQVPSNYCEKIETDCAPAAEDFHTFPWFTDSDRRTSEDAVSRGGRIGTFVVRPSSSQKGDYTLTALGSNGIMNLKIQQRDSHYVLGQFSSRFGSIQELIKHHQSSEIKVTGKKALLLTSPP
eukprot:m.415407 g.415407  ORF g.415407 m.415407 type:complete len:521 (+) comp29619_c0_seq1:142-1704(+)